MARTRYDEPDDEDEDADGEFEADYDAETDYDPDDPDTYPAGVYLDGDNGRDTLQCPHCSAEIDAEAQQCPKCGNYLSAEDAPPQSRSTFIMVVLVLALLGAVLMTLG